MSENLDAVTDTEHAINEYESPRELAEAVIRDEFIHQAEFCKVLFRLMSDDDKAEFLAFVSIHYGPEFDVSFENPMKYKRWNKNK